MLVSDTKYASDSDRWYDPKTQESVNDCLAKNGNTKKVTLREARKEGYVPSVTTILHSLSKPALEKWKVKQYLEVAHRSRGLYWDQEDWIKEVIRVGDEEMSVAKDKGQEIHGDVDRWLEEGMPEPVSPHVKAARAALNSIIDPSAPYDVETTFCRQRNGVWVAGKCDLHYPRAGVIVDWKSSKSACDGSEKLGYDEHVMQGACYSMALFNDLIPDFHNVFLSTSNPGAFQVVRWTTEDLARGWGMYCAAYQLWTLSKNYRP